MKEQRAESSRRLRLSFDEFGWEAVAEEADARRIPEAAFFAEACIRHSRGRGDDRLSLSRPAFRPCSGTVREVAVTAQQSVWARLEREAPDQGITIEELVEHLVLLELARPPG